MSNEPKYQVFISSTYTDLIEARSAAINTVLESYNFPVGMELFGADNDEQWIIIRDLIDSSDFYILILGHRYGSISKQDGISFTEKEFDYALEKGIKLMCFVRKDNVATLPHERDEDASFREKLSQFRIKVTTDRTCEFWDNVDDLKHKISSSLYKNMRKHGGVGWVRGNQVSGQLAEELAKLSEENRKLREENERLKQNFLMRKPHLKVFLNGMVFDNMLDQSGVNIKFPFLKDEDKFKFPNKRIKQTNIDEFEQLNKPIHNINRMLGIRNPEDFYEKYNDEIDAITSSQVEKHNQSLQLMEQLNFGIFGVLINIENKGTLLATDIDINIEVPDFISIIDNNSKLDINYYREMFSQGCIKIKTPEERSTEVNNYSLITKEVFRGSGFKMPYLKNLEHYIGEDSRLHISLKSLLHSKSETIKDFHFFPLKKGTGVIKMNVICAEYSHLESFEIPITVE